MEKKIFNCVAGVVENFVTSAPHGFGAPELPGHETEFMKLLRCLFYVELFENID